MSSSYYLAVDVGTSRTAAATARLSPDGSLLATPFSLGRSSDSAPSAMFVTGGELLFGDAAERRGITEPERLVREFKRRIGDDIPILAGDQRFTPEEVYALMVGWVVDLVSEREARLPHAIAVTVPVAWGEYRTQLVEEALARRGWSSVTLVTEPEAAARHYESTSPLPAGRALAVYDLGGGTFDAIVLQKDSDGYVQVAGEPVGLGDLGGSDFDDAVLRHTLAAAGVEAAALTADDRMALAALRRECVDAKESLSFDSEVVIPVLLGSGHGTVRLTRDEFEGMIDDRIARTTEALAMALESAGVEVDDIESILLTGGSSRIPHIAQVLSERFDRPIAIDADPKAIIALGAVRVLSDHASAPVVAPVVPAAPVVASIAPAVAAAAESAVATPATADPANAEREGKGRKWRLPTFAYLSAGSLVLGMGLVVASASAMGNGSPIGQAADSALVDTLLAHGMADRADAAELPAGAASQADPAPAPAPGAAQPISATPKQPSDGNAIGRRVGPKADTAVRVTPTPTNGSSSTTAQSPAGSGSSGGSNAASGTTPGGSTGTAPSNAGDDPTPTTEPSTEPTAQPTIEPTAEPTTEPTNPPADPDPAADPPPADSPPPSDPVTETQTTDATPEPTPSPTASLE